MIDSRVLNFRSLAVLCTIVLALLIGAPHANAMPSVLSPSPTAWNFGNGDIHGAGGSTQTFTFTNNTAGNVNVNGVAAVGGDPSDFQLSANTCLGAFLRPGASCSVQVTFRPNSVGPASASLEVTDSTGTVDVPMAGIGITGTLSASPNPLVFQPQPWYDGGQQLQVTIQDSFDAGVQATSTSITGPDAPRFAITSGQNCATQSYGPGQFCTVWVSFNPPNGPGVFHAQLEIASDSQSSPSIVPLTAAALLGPTAVVAPSQADFGNVAIGSSAAQTVTISNSGDSPLYIQGSFMVGTASSFPVIADGCSGQQVNPGSACQMTVGFQPTASGYRDATMIVLTNLNRNVVPVAFSGTGLPTLDGAATITGTAAAGSTLTCNPIGYPPGTGFQYQWLDNGHPVAGAGTPTFVPLDADVGQRVACRVTSTNSVSTQTVTSPASAPIAPMTLTDELGAFIAEQSCRAVQAEHLMRVGHHDAVIRYAQPVTPWAPLTISSTARLEVRVDGRTVAGGARASITPRALSAIADGVHTLTVGAAGVTTQGQLVLAPCQLAAHLQGGPRLPTTISASSRYGIRALTFHLPRQLRLRAGAGQDVGTATYISAGYPPSQFELIGPHTSWNNVRVTLASHAITITNVPIQTGVINITLRPGVIAGGNGNLTATARVRGTNAPQLARTPTSWLPWS